MQELEQQIRPLMAAAAVPGLSLTLIRDYQVRWSQAFGVQRCPVAAPVTAETVFEAGSLSKPVFAYAALQLCQAGLLHLDTPLSEYLPEPYLPEEPRLSQLTLRHVLSHTTGFPNWRPAGQPLRMHFSPGERFSYSGEGYVYLQTVVEHVTGQPACEYVAAALLEPLAMTHSRFVWTGHETLPVALGHDGTGTPVTKYLWRQMNAAASLHCTAIDFAQFMLAVMRPSAENASHLEAELTRTMLTPHVAVNDSAPWHPDWPKPQIKLNERISWGLGWGIQESASRLAFWHWGDTGSYRAFALGSCEGHGLVIMTNGKNGHRVIRSILTDLIGGEYPALDWLEEIYAG